MALVELLWVPTMGCCAARTIHHPVGRRRIERHVAPQSPLYQVRPSRRIATGAVASHRRDTVSAVSSGAWRASDCVKRNLHRTAPPLVDRSYLGVSQFACHTRRRTCRAQLLAYSCGSLALRLSKRQLAASVSKHAASRAFVGTFVGRAAALVNLSECGQYVTADFWRRTAPSYLDSANFL